LASKIDAEIKKFQSGEAFVKLSSRSPKDATVKGDRTAIIIRDLKKQWKEKHQNESFSDQDKLEILNQAHINALRVTTGKETVALFCESDRIWEDLDLGLESGNFAQQVIIREWNPIPLKFEFRGFVCNRKLTALSQYYFILFFKDIKNNKEEIQNIVFQTFEKIKDILPIDSVVVDFAVDLKNKRAIVIEINPFDNYIGCGTSPALFDWKKDRKTLDEGPFEFRIEETQRPEFRKLLGNEWKEYMDQWDQL